MRIDVRRGVASDVDVIAEFNRRLALETESKQLDPQVLRAGVATLLGDPAKGLYYLAENEGTVIGQLAVTYEWSDWRNGWLWWIQSVYVRADHRRRGVFRSLYEAVRQTALQAGDVVGIRLYVETDNDVGQRTYVGVGMARTGYLVMEECPLLR